MKIVILVILTLSSLVLSKELELFEQNKEQISCSSQLTENLFKHTYIKVKVLNEMQGLRGEQLRYISELKLSSFILFIISILGFTYFSAMLVSLIYYKYFGKDKSKSNVFFVFQIQFFLILIIFFQLNSFTLTFFNIKEQNGEIVNIDDISHLANKIKSEDEYAMFLKLLSQKNSEIQIKLRERALFNTSNPYKFISFGLFDVQEIDYEYRIFQLIQKMNNLDLKVTRNIMLKVANECEEKTIL